MPKAIFRRFAPDRRSLRRYKALSILGDWLHDPNLWHLNRRSVSGAFAVGLFCAWMPVPFQMVLAALVALPLRVNLPLSVALVWVTNPVTIPVMFYGAYKVGAWMLGDGVGVPFAPEVSWRWFVSVMAVSWRPFLFGSFVMAVFSAAAGYVGVLLFWRWHVTRQWKRRQRRGRRKG